MRKTLLAIGAVALICLAGFVAAQAAPQDQASAEASAATASQPDQGTKLRLARMDTSAAAFRKLDTDNDGRISPLEAADNPRVAAAFTIADQDKDGYLSKEEFASMGSAANRSADVDASSPSGDRVSGPSGDQVATGPNDPGPTSTGPSSASPRPRVTPHQK